MVTTASASPLDGNLLGNLAVTGKIRTRKQRLFQSVFPTDVSQPTPLLPATELGQLFGGPYASAPLSALRDGNKASTTAAAPTANTTSTTNSGADATSSASTASTDVNAPHAGKGGSKISSIHQAAAAARDQVLWDRAWHVVTSRIQLPSSVAVEDSFGTLAPESQDLDATFYESLTLLLDPTTTVPYAKQTEDIFSWHSLQVRQHFLHHVLPLLAACTSSTTITPTSTPGRVGVQLEHSQAISSIIGTLEAAHRQYLYCLHLIIRGIQNETAAESAMTRFSRDLHAIVGSSWTPGLVTALRSVLHHSLRIILGSGQSSRPRPGPRGGRNRDGNVDGHQDSGLGPGWNLQGDASKARNELFSLLEPLQKVGVGGDKFQILFAELMDGCMQDFIRDSYSKVWKVSDGASRRSSRPAAASPVCMDHLCDWIENQYGRLAVEVLSRLGGQVAWSNVEQWRDIAIGRLATLRMHELFDIVLHWPDSRGGLDDLGSAVTTPQRRLQLTDIFSASLQKRLLHPGRSTLDILKTYISMIRTFHALDHSKVLLDRVVPALKLCLWNRDDAIRIVVTGLLATPTVSTPEESKGKLVELAVILNETSQQQNQQRSHADDEDLDWNDMSWVPDPIDAGVNYKRPKNEDIIGTLISALGLQDVFIKEFQAIVAERLLSKKPGFQQEIKVLSLLKKRFGEAALQNCDVMIKDIMDSKRLDAILRRNIRSEGDAEAAPPSYHSKILSRLFWPSLSNDPFTVPAPVAEIQRKYEAGFEQLKSSRKLNWINHLGSATVKLDLKDRSVELECKTYEAAVIYEFHDESSGSSPAQRSFNEIWEKLMIDEDLLESALKFWVSKRVLRDAGNQTYVVLERLDDENNTRDKMEEAAEPNGTDYGQPSPKKTKGIDAKEKERQIIYWQFIVGMLTNSSPAMPLGQIAMMMKMLIADGCPWSNEELQEFLGEKVAENELELAGGKYRLPKK